VSESLEPAEHPLPVGRRARMPVFRPAVPRQQPARSPCAWDALAGFTRIRPTRPDEPLAAVKDLQTPSLLLSSSGRSRSQTDISQRRQVSRPRSVAVMANAIVRGHDAAMDLAGCGARAKSGTSAICLGCGSSGVPQNPRSCSRSGGRRLGCPAFCPVWAAGESRPGVTALGRLSH